MSALFVLIGVSILVAGSFLVVFLWSVSAGQFDDDYTPSVRILFDDEPSTPMKEGPMPVKQHEITKNKS
jgi:cbb3-type cytochrome oxidase maturation protein